MGDLTRRSFLKGVVVVGAGLALADFSILLPGKKALAGFREFGSFRAMCVYDIEQDQDMIRYDILAKGKQMKVQGYLKNEMKEDYINQVHKPFVMTLKNALRMDGIGRRDLQKLDYPAGYRHPKWFMDVLGLQAIG